MENVRKPGRPVRRSGATRRQLQDKEEYDVGFSDNFYPIPGTSRADPDPPVRIGPSVNEPVGRSEFNDFVLELLTSSDDTPILFPPPAEEPVHAGVTLFCSSPVASQVLAQEEDSDSEPPPKRGRPPKKRRGRPPRTPGISPAERHVAAVRRYEDANKDEVRKRHRMAVATYNRDNPEVNRAAVSRYRGRQPDQYRDGNTDYNRTSRPVPVSVRSIPCLGNATGDTLNKIKPLRLKETSLLSNSIPRCFHCGAKLFFEEKKTRAKWCCGEGKYFVNVLPPLSGSFYNDEAFLSNARKYNNLFAFSSLFVDGRFIKFNNPLNFVKIQGRTYHKLYDLSFQSHNMVNNTALYINDESERLRIGQGLNSNIIKAINDYLAQNNKFVGVLKNLAAEKSSEARIIFPPKTRRAAGTIVGAPTAPEIAALIVSTPTSDPRQVAIWKIGEGKPRQVNFLSEIYEPLHYPLIYPHASRGWSINMVTASGEKVSQVMYYRCQLLSDPRFPLLRRLTQEWLVDMWSRAEEERLLFMRNQQKSGLRIATRRDIDETIAGGGTRNPGKVFLPASYTQSPRWYQIKYHESMAIVTRLGRPSFFLTVTCNPNWPEIQESLLPNQTAMDRPDLCTRVFQLKLLELKKMIVSGKLLGPNISLLYIIEFQSRGLPHSHISCAVQDPPSTGFEIDQFVRATIPSEQEAGGRLRALVLKHMIHGECGINNPKAPCMDQETHRCSKRYPKPFVPTTYLDQRGYVNYKRPETDNDVQMPNRRRMVNNSHVIPYNPAILLLMDCHANLEVATGVKVIKYLYKYIYKGSDRAKVGIFDANDDAVVDEISHYVNARYISASEAAWRIYEFDLCCRIPTVITLPIHLPNEDAIIFEAGEQALAAQRSPSKLVLYLSRPHVDELMNLTYLDFFEQYTVENKKRRNPLTPCIEHPDGVHFIYKRLRRDCVARIHFISPVLGEIYFLRLILMKVPASSFEDIKTVDGQVLDTFQAAAHAHGLLEDHEEFREALLEAALFKTGRALRQFYFALLISGAPVGILYNELKHKLSEDYLERHPNNPDLAYTLGLCDLDHMLRVHGRTLEFYGLPDVPDQTTELGREEARWLGSDCIDFADQWEPKLSGDQTAIYDLLVKVANDVSNPGGVYFIDGAAGTGKTLLLNVLTARLRSQGHVVLCTASTGIAALNHVGGTTAHAMFRLPTDLEEAQTKSWNVVNTSQRADLIRSAKLIIYDEAPMANAELLDILNRGLKDVCDPLKLFGGKFIIFAGDFRQIPPVIKKGSPHDVIAASIKFAPFWKQVVKLKLTSSQRTKDDPEYSNTILAIGEDRVPRETIDNVPCISLTDVPVVFNFDDLLSFVYPPEVLNSPNDCCKRAILTGTNLAVRIINQKIFEALPQPVIHCYSTDKLCGDSSPDNMLDVAVLNSLTDSSVPDHDLALKVNAVVILMRNLDFTEGLVNGTKLIVDQISRRFIQVRKPNETNTLLIPRISFKFSVGDKGPEILRMQFPLKLAYAMTFNKSQGQTLDCVGVDLRSDVFSHGQLYVALGRVRRRDAIKVLIPQERTINDQNFTYNIVLNELIKD